MSHAGEVGGGGGGGMRPCSAGLERSEARLGLVVVHAGYPGGQVLQQRLQRRLLAHAPVDQRALHRRHRRLAQHSTHAAVAPLAAWQRSVREQLTVDRAERGGQRRIRAHVLEQDHDAGAQLGLELCVAKDTLQHLNDGR